MEQFPPAHNRPLTPAELQDLLQNKPPSRGKPISKKNKSVQRRPRYKGVNKVVGTVSKPSSEKNDFDSRPCTAPQMFSEEYVELNFCRSSWATPAAEVREKEKATELRLKLVEKNRKIEELEKQVKKLAEDKSTLELSKLKKFGEAQGWKKKYLSALSSADPLAQALKQQQRVEDDDMISEPETDAHEISSETIEEAMTTAFTDVLKDRVDELLKDTDSQKTKYEMLLSQFRKQSKVLQDYKNRMRQMASSFSARTLTQHIPRTGKHKEISQDPKQVCDEYEGIKSIANTMENVSTLKLMLRRERVSLKKVTKQEKRAMEVIHNQDRRLDCKEEEVSFLREELKQIKEELKVKDREILKQRIQVKEYAGRHERYNKTLQALAAQVTSPTQQKQSPSELKRFEEAKQYNEYSDESELPGKQSRFQLSKKTLPPPVQRGNKDSVFKIALLSLVAENKTVEARATENRKQKEKFEELNRSLEQRVMLLRQQLVKKEHSISELHRSLKKYKKRYRKLGAQTGTRNFNALQPIGAVGIPLNTTLGPDSAASVNSPHGSDHPVHRGAGRQPRGLSAAVEGSYVSVEDTQVAELLADLQEYSGDCPETLGAVMSQLVNMVSISRDLLEANSLASLCGRVAKEAKRVFKAEFARLFLLSRDNTQLVTNAGEGAENESHSIDRGIPGYIASTGETVFIPDMQQCEMFTSEDNLGRTGAITSNCIGIPICGPGTNSETQPMREKKSAKGLPQQRSVIGVIVVSNLHCEGLDSTPSRELHKSNRVSGAAESMHRQSNSNPRKHTATSAKALHRKESVGVKRAGRGGPECPVFSIEVEVLVQLFAVQISEAVHVQWLQQQNQVLQERSVEILDILPSLHTSFVESSPLIPVQFVHRIEDALKKVCGTDRVIVYLANHSSGSQICFSEGSFFNRRDRKGGKGLNTKIKFAPLNNSGSIAAKTCMTGLVQKIENSNLCEFYNKKVDMSAEVRSCSMVCVPILKPRECFLDSPACRGLDVAMTLGCAEIEIPSSTDLLDLRKQMDVVIRNTQELLRQVSPSIDSMWQIIKSYSSIPDDGGKVLRDESGDDANEKPKVTPDSNSRSEDSGTGINWKHARQVRIQEQFSHISDLEAKILNQSLVIKQLKHQLETNEKGKLTSTA